MMIEGYKELLNSINLHKHLREVAEINYVYNDKILYSNSPTTGGSPNLDGMPKGNRNAKDLIYVIQDMQKWLHMREIEEDIIKRLEKQKRLIDECINQSDITVKVAQLRSMGLTQEQVAELIDRHVNTVKNIEKKIKNCT